MIITNATREELIELGKQLIAAKTDEESIGLYNEFNSHFSHPDVANLFFYPENYNHREDWQSISEYSPSVEEIVDIGINHRPIEL